MCLLGPLAEREATCSFSGKVILMLGCSGYQMGYIAANSDALNLRLRPVVKPQLRRRQDARETHADWHWRHMPRIGK